MPGRVCLALPFCRQSGATIAVPGASASGLGRGRVLRASRRNGELRCPKQLLRNRIAVCLRFTSLPSAPLQATLMEPVPTRAIYGFALASSQVDPSSSLPVARAGAVTPQPMPGLTVKLPPTPQLSAHNSSKVHASSATSFHQPAQQAPAPAPATPSSADHLGWKGLLEISRNSGASGVLGGRQAPVEEVGPAKDTKIEICCTAHTGPAVKRLVKSVIRGLKACQVSLSACHLCQLIGFSKLCACTLFVLGDTLGTYVFVCTTGA
jgi:hypothetical protein